MSWDISKCTFKERWADVENPEFVEWHRKIAEDPNEDPEEVEMARAMLDWVISEDLKDHIRGSPLFELSSVKLTLNFSPTDDIMGCINAGDPGEVYGHIRLIDNKGNMFTVFKLDYENAKHVIFDEGSPIIFKKPQLGTPRILPKNLKLHVFLKDRVHNVVLFDNFKFLSFSREVLYDNVSYCTLDYNVGHFQPNSLRLQSFLEFGYTVFHCAVLASVSVTVLGVGNDHPRGRNLKLRSLIKLRNSQHSHELFDDEPSKLEIGVPREMCVLAVPVYSSLKIIATFNFGGVDDTVEKEFYPSDTHAELEEKVEGKNCQMLLSVTWKNGIKTLPERYLREWDDAPSSSDNDTDSEIKKWDIVKKPPCKKPFKVHHSVRMMKEICDRNGYFIQPQLEVLDEREWVVTMSTSELVELFSVSIHSFEGAVSSSITGKILVSGSTINRLDCFSGSEKKTGIIYPSIDDRCLIDGSNFYMEFDLEDANGYQISWGCLLYEDRNVDPWYNRRLCSVVVGKCGYAAAYYTIFECAKMARLKVKLMMPENNNNHNNRAVVVSGTIHGRYGNFSYSTKYDKDYFQSTLFEEGKSESVVVDGEIPLTKSAVAVPRNGSLIVRANLRVSIDGEHVETLKGKATFKLPNDVLEIPPEQKIISCSAASSMYQLSVDVVWGYPECIWR